MRIDRAHWNRLPSFAAPEPSPAWALARHPVALLALLAWTVVPATLLARQARRLAP
jgi:hypothetical protein